MMQPSRQSTEHRASDRDDEITPARLAECFADGSCPMLLDVREAYEWAIGRLPDAHLVPLAALRDAVPMLDRTAEYCHHGIRSASAVEWLREQGFARVRNLTGGIDRWSREVNPLTRRP